MSSRLTIVLSAAAVLLGLSFTGASTAHSAGMKCKKIKGTLTSVADLVNFTTTGTIDGSLRGTTFFAGDGASLTPIASVPSPPVAPTFSYTGDLSIQTRKGSLTTRSVGVFEFVPFGLGTQFDTVIGGTGDFAGATGFVYFNFRANDTASGFTSTYKGEVCTP